MKRLSAILISATCMAQPAFPTSGPQVEVGGFDDFMNEAFSDFDNFLDEANSDFIEFLRCPWDKFEAEKPIEKRAVPEPEKQPEMPPQEEQPQVPNELSVEKPKEQTKPKEPQKETPKTPWQPTLPIKKGQPKKEHPKKEYPKKEQPQKEQPQKEQPKVDKDSEQPRIPVQEELPADGMPVSFGGITYRVSDALKGRVPQVALNEKSIANAYESLLRDDYKPLIDNLRQLRNNGLNNDWALYLFVKDTAEKLASGNSAILLRQFLLNQLGYRARVAIVPAENRLVLFFASDIQLFGVVYIDLNGARYYDIESKSPYSFLMCTKEAPAAKSRIDMQIAALPAIKGERLSKTHTGRDQSSDVSVSASVPEELVKYYARIPQCDYVVYTSAPADNKFAQDVLSQLKKAVSGLSKQEGAALLLDYVQKGFAYATDHQQFGYEKPFFIEELFYYPKCDCEDRAVFFRYLVKNILGLDVVLLEYPNHLATAVDFGEKPSGDYVTVRGRAYTVCDPTYIGASPGMAMPQFKNVSAKVVDL